MSEICRPQFRELAPHTLRELADQLESGEVDTIIVTWFSDGETAEHLWFVAPDRAMVMVGALEVSKRELIHARLNTWEKT